MEGKTVKRNEKQKRKHAHVADSQKQHQKLEITGDREKKYTKEFYKIKMKFILNQKQHSNKLNKQMYKIVLVSQLVRVTSASLMFMQQMDVFVYGLTMSILLQLL